MAAASEWCLIMASDDFLERVNEEIMTSSISLNLLTLSTKDNAPGYQHSHCLHVYTRNDTIDRLVSLSKLAELEREMAPV